MPRLPRRRRQARHAAASSYQECLAWALRSAGRLSSAGGGAEQGAAAAERAFVQQLCAGTLQQQLAPAALASSADSEDAAAIVVGVLAASSRGCPAGSSAVVVATGAALSAAVEAAVAAAAAQDSSSDATFQQVQQLLERFKGSSGEAATQLADHVASVLAPCVHCLGSTAATQLLAACIREHGAMGGAAAGDAGPLAPGSIARGPSGGALAAPGYLAAACLGRQECPAACAVRCAAAWAARLPGR
jgi:hypothetical protein